MEEHRHTKWSEIRARRLPDPEQSAAYMTVDRTIKIGEQVRHIREARGMSQAELARRMATSQSAIARLEAGGVDPKLGTLERLSRALNADLVLELRVTEAGEKQNFRHFLLSGPDLSPLELERVRESRP